jgi:hypothetical protein
LSFSSMSNLNTFHWPKVPSNICSCFCTAASNKRFSCELKWLLCWIICWADTGACFTSNVFLTPLIFIRIVTATLAVNQTILVRTTTRTRTRTRTCVRVYSLCRGHASFFCPRNFPRPFRMVQDNCPPRVKFVHKIEQIPQLWLLVTGSKSWRIICFCQEAGIQTQGCPSTRHWGG